MRRGPKVTQQVTGLLTIVPGLFLILALTIYPVGYSMWLSLLEKHSFFPEQRFIGLDNYIYLWSDAEFWTNLWYGVMYSVWTITLQILLGVAAALILNESFRGRNLARGIVLFPCRQYGRTGLTYRIIVGCSGEEQSHRRKEAGHEPGYYTRGPR